MTTTNSGGFGPSRITSGYDPELHLYFLKTNGSVLISQLESLPKGYRFAGFSGLATKRRVVSHLPCRERPADGSAKA